MSKLTRRIERLERAEDNRPVLTEAQLDEIVLYFGAAALPESLVDEQRALKNSAAYERGRKWAARRNEQRSRMSEAELEEDARAHERIYSSHAKKWWNAGLQNWFVKAWRQEIRNVPCPVGQIPWPE